MLILNYKSKKELKEQVGRPLDYTETSMFGPEYKPPGFRSTHSSLLGYAAVMNADDKLAALASKTFISTKEGLLKGEPILATQRVTGPDSLNPVDEATWVSTNRSAQWGLNAIRISALVPDEISDYR